MEDFYEKPSRVARSKRLQKKEADVYLVKRRKPKQRKHECEDGVSYASRNKYKYLDFDVQS